MDYLDRIDKLISSVSPDFINFDEERQKRSAPTQVSSEFLTNKEQGDWAEKTLLNGINNNSSKYVAVKYGRDDDIVAGEEGFKEFYEKYQYELDTIGKRPDLLIFLKKDFPYKTNNISHFSIEELDNIVPKAKCGIEVRSSAFLINKYEDFMTARNASLIKQAMSIKNTIITNYSALLRNKNPELFKIINMLSSENIQIILYRTPCWKSSSELSQLCKLLKDLKSIISQISERTFLSITPKVEDLKVVYNWIKKYKIPHYYVQVFFDKAYGISFERILDLIGSPDLEGKEYFIEGDVKNQNKTTIKIQANKEMNILKKIDLPKHHSEMKELGRGRLLYYVKFEDSLSVINNTEFKKLFGFDLI